MFVITALSATLFLGFISNTITLRKRADLYLDASELSDLIVQVSSFETADKDFLSRFSPEYRIYSDGEFKKAGEAGQSNIAKIFVSDTERNKPYIVEGEAGVLIDKTVAGLGRNGSEYKVGDEIEIEFTAFKPLFEQFNVPSSYTFTITGLMHSVEGVNIYSNSPVFLSEEVVLEAIKSALPMPSLANGVIGYLYNQALIESDNYAEEKEEIREYFSEKAESNLLFVYDRDTMESVVILDNEVEQSKNMLYIFPVIFFLVSVLVIMTSISRLILRERINIGTFKALGMGNGRIMFHYAFMGAAVTFLGCLAGAVLGPLIVPAVMTVKYGLIFSMPKMTATVFSVPWTAGFTLAFSLLSLAIGFWAARSVIKENPAECMRPKQIAYTPKVMRGTGRSKNSRHLLLSCRMALRNIRINSGRSLMTVIGVAGCAALLLTSFGIGDTMQASVENDYGYLSDFDVTSPYAAAQEESFFETLEQLKADGKIEFYERVRTYVATAHTAKQSKDISVYVFEKGSKMNRVTEGGNTLSRITADVLGVKKGERFTFTLGACSAEYEIEDVVPTSTWNGFFTSENYFSDDCYFQENVWVRTAYQDEVRDALNEVNGTGTAKTMADRRGEIESLISSTNAMKYTLMVFAVLLSVVVLYNLSLLNVKERTRDMATMKVLGFDNFQVSFALIMEILILTLVGTLIGSCFGYPLMYLVMKLNEMATMAFIYALKPLSYLLTVFGSLLTAAAINGVFGLLISKISMTESLKSVE